MPLIPGFRYAPNDPFARNEPTSPAGQIPEPHLGQDENSAAISQRQRLADAVLKIVQKPPQPEITPDPPATPVTRLRLREILGGGHRE